MVTELELLEFTKYQSILNGNEGKEITYCSFHFYLMFK
jgi:hypothetical protein